MPFKVFRRGRLAPLAAALVAALGIGVAVAVAAVTTSTATQCATTTAPAHTVAVDGSDVKTVGGDSLSVCATATATATDRTVTTTVPGPTTTVTTTATTTPTNPNVQFDGSARLMNTLYSYETTYGDTSTLTRKQDPAVWACLCFMQNDVSLASDSTFGKAYDVNVPTGDANPFNWTPTYPDGAAQLSTRRTNDLGKWDYFSGAVKVNSWNGPMSDLYFVDLWSLGYETAEGDQVGFRLWGGPKDAGPLQFAVAQNAGYVNSPSSFQAGTTNYLTAFQNVTFGQWEEFVFAVKESSHQDGEVAVYSRVPGGTWSKVFDKTGVDTWLYGTTQYGTFPQNPSSATTVIDKIGLYFREYGGESEHVQESGLIRSTDLATAESTLP